MKFSCDLHTHSTYSDGELTVTELLEKAAKAGLSAIAVSDHDNIENWLVIEKEAKKNNLEFLYAAELSSYDNTHDIYPEIMIYFTNSLQYQVLSEFLEKVRYKFNSRWGVATIKRINQHFDLNLDSSELLNEATKQKKTLMTVILQTLASQDKITFNEAGQKYLTSETKIPYKDGCYSVEEIIAFINKLGGFTSWAHPLYTVKKKRLGMQDIRKIAEYYKKLGIKGIEISNNKHSEEETLQLDQIAKQLNLISTGGSDWHGPIINPTVDFGQYGTDEKVYTAIKKQLQNTK